MQRQYDSRDIQVLDGMDAIRMRPGMYIGSTGHRGLHHLLWEIVDNAIDEASNGFATQIGVILHTDGSACVWDNGRGVPVSSHPLLGIPGVEVIYTKLHAGGKFNQENYSYSSGLHGVGASVVNALSKWLTVDSYRDYTHYRMEFVTQIDPKTKKLLPGQVKGGLQQLGGTRKKGTSVRFLPDDTVFEEHSFNGETVSRRLRELAYLNKGVRIDFSDERVRDEDKRQRVFQYDGGITDYVKYLNANKTPLNEIPIYLEGSRDATICRAVIQYTDDYTENVYSYVNNVLTGEGGTHETGFRAAFTKVFNDYARKIGALKEKDNNLAGEDFREGLTCVLTVMVVNPQFEGQTKGRLGNTEVRPAVEAIIGQRLAEYLDDLRNQEICQKIVEKALSAARARDAAKKAREVARQRDKSETAPLVGKLSSCTGRKSEENELFIVEGDSAGGSAKQGRDRRFQAILPLRGKPLNAEKKQLDKVLDNEEFRSIITALGVGIEKNFDVSGLKYHKVIILSDADQDGAHIRAILLTFFYRYMRELITGGYIYIGMPPLYKLQKGDKIFYAYDDRQLKKVQKEVGSGFTLQRYKGLGEMNPDQLWQTTMDPACRMLVQVTLDDAAEAGRIITVLMGDKVEPRREYISAHANFNRDDRFEPVSDEGGK